MSVPASVDQWRGTGGTSGIDGIGGIDSIGGISAISAISAINRISSIGGINRIDGINRIGQQVSNIRIDINCSKEQFNDGTMATSGSESKGSISRTAHKVRVDAVDFQELFNEVHMSSICGVLKSHMDTFWDRIEMLTNSYRLLNSLSNYCVFHSIFYRPGQ
jgi:hypothetical protein